MRNQAAAVDLVVNTFERTRDRVLTPGFFPRIAAMQVHRVARCVLLINNVADIADAKRRADELVRAGEIDAYHVVAEHLDSALDRTGLSRRDLGRILHYSDCALVAVAIPGSDWLLYWDAEIELTEPRDWVSPAIDLMERDARVLVTNPSWGDGVDEEAVEHTGEFALGYGFSDQVFLARRRELARPIYGERCLASWRYPMTPIAFIFEARLDAYMRAHRRLRATYRGASYDHRPRSSGSVPLRGLRERWRRLVRRRALRRLRRSSSDDPCERVWWR